MGTTMVALAVVDEDGDEVLAVANVGDSRVYRYSVGELDQLTDDHSLVADLVREGTLSPGGGGPPAAQHRHRAPSVNDRVPVDTLTVDPVAGDRYLLCSDGLFNEVPSRHRRCASVVTPPRRPTSSCTGGRRWRTRQRHRRRGRRRRRRRACRAASDALAVGAASGLAAEAAGMTETEDGSAGGRRTRALEATNGSQDGAGPHGRRRSETAGPAAHVAGPAVLLILLALVGGAFATIQWYGRSTYFVGFEGDRGRSSRDARAASCGSIRCWRRRPTSNGPTSRPTPGTTSRPARSSPRSPTPTGTSTG